jgi:Protein of unknown function (DUF2852)
MTSANGAGGAFTQDQWQNAPWRCASGRSHWTAFELAAMVLGFILFWPIGLAILLYKMWTRRYGGQDLQTVATNAFATARDAVGAAASPKGATPSPWRGFASSFTSSRPATSGNRAFDEWKTAQVAKLEEERRKLDEQRQKLDEAHREFDAFVDQVRQAKDRDEFERFMRERGPKEG